jgi:hypothetical protein
VDHAIDLGDGAQAVAGHGHASPAGSAVVRR